MKPKTMKGKDWEKEFDEQFWGRDKYAVKKVKSFISQLLKEQREELKKKVEGMIGWVSRNSEYGENSDLDPSPQETITPEKVIKYLKENILTLLEEQKEEK